MAGGRGRKIKRRSKPVLPNTHRTTGNWLNALTFETSLPRLGTLYYAFRDFAAEYPESSKIYRFID